jgi:hypothetical protein
VTLGPAARTARGLLMSLSLSRWSLVDLRCYDRRIDEIEKILREINALRERIDLDKEDLRTPQISDEVLRDILTHIDWCNTEIELLKACLAETRNRPQRQA